MLGKIEKRNLFIYTFYLCLLLGFFLYANFTGWRLFNTDEVEHVSKGNRSHGSSRFYHK